MRNEAWSEIPGSNRETERPSPQGFRNVFAPGDLGSASIPDTLLPSSYSPLETQHNTQYLSWKPSFSPPHDFLITTLSHTERATLKRASKDTPQPSPCPGGHFFLGLVTGTAA